MRLISSLTYKHTDSFTSRTNLSTDVPFLGHVYGSKLSNKTKFCGREYTILQKFKYHYLHEIYALD